MKIALVGIGKIAIDQHVPAINANPDWQLAATVSRNGSVDGIEAFSDMDTMLSQRPDIDVVSLCLPPVPRFDYAKKAILAGRHVMLEKPPGATLAECHALLALAAQQGVSLFASWHSRAADLVAPAKRWLGDKTILSAHIQWHENVRKWHPDQNWIFEAGGMGVFDPGINALSILTEILPNPVFLRQARLGFPSNRDTPIEAELRFSDNVTASFNWDHQGADVWDIRVETSGGPLLLRDGGARLSLNGQDIPQDDIAKRGEYPRLYDQMAAMVQTGETDMDLAPLTHVADAFMLGKRYDVAPFEW